MGISISDFDKPCGKDLTCSRCPSPATDLIEWQDDDYGGRWWERFCEPCMTIAVHIHNECARFEREAQEAEARKFEARFGFKPDTFCEDCGYRATACRCAFDPLRQGSGNVAFTSRR